MNRIKLDAAPGTDILKVDGGDGVVTSSLQHVAGQAPVLGVKSKLQDLVIGVIITIHATWIQTSVQVTL